MAASDRAAWQRTSKRRSSRASIEAVGRALRHAHREHARQAAADGEVLVRIDQRVDELADALLRHLLQREHRVVGDRIPGQQRNHVRHEHRRQPFFARQHVDDALAVTRAQAEDVLHVGIELRHDWLRRCPRAAAPPSRRPRMSSRLCTSVRVEAGVALSSTRCRRRSGVMHQAALERADVAAIQPARGEDGARGAGDGERENGRRLQRRAAARCVRRTRPPPTASPRRSNATSISDLAARFSAAGIGV